MLWQVLALVVAAVLVIAGVAAFSVPAAAVTAGVLLACGALLLDPDALKKGGKP